MSNKRTLAFIFCTATLDILALAIVVQVLPLLLLGFASGDAASAAEMLALFAFLWGSMQFLCSPLLGALSDRFGRRPVILISCLGLSLDHVLMAVAPTIELLLVGRLISGVTSATVATARAYVADVSSPEQRAQAFGVIGMSFGIGFVLGPAIGGFLAEIDPRLPFWASAAASLANALFGWFVLPESLPPARRMPFTWKRANPVGALVLLLSHRELPRLATIHVFITLVQQVLPAAFVLYTAHRYGWNEKMIGITLVVLGLCSAAVQGLLVGPLVRWLGPRRALIFGLLSGSAGMAIYAFAPSGPWFWLGVPAAALWSLSSPSLQHLMTGRVSASEQGQLQGANNSLRSLSVMVGPAIFGGLFAWFVEPLPAAPFFAASLLLLIAATVAWLVIPPPERVP